MEQNQQQPASPTVQPKKRSFSGKLLRFFMWTGFVFVLLLGTAGLLGYLYRDEIKGYVVNEANKYLNTKVIVEAKDIDLTIFSSFPNASVQFSNVKALDAIDIPHRDTLFKAGKIGLEFNIWDIFSGNYRIHHIGAEDVNLDVWIDKNGRDNYHFLKESQDTTANDTAHASFALESITLKNIRVRYRDRKNKSDYRLDLHETNCSGDFSSDNFTFSADSRFHVYHLKQDSATFFSDNDGKLNLEMDVDNKSGTYSLKECALRLSDFVLNTGGKIVQGEKETKLDLSVKGDDIDLPAALSLLPAKYRENISDLESEGKFLVDATIKGIYSETQKPVVKASFSTSEGTELRKKGSEITLQDVAVKGSYSNEPGKSGIDINAFSFHSAQSRLSGNLHFRDLDNMQVEASVEGKLALDEMRKFLLNDTIELAGGTIDLGIKSSGKPKNPKSFKAEDLRHFSTTGEITFNGVAMHLENSSMKADSVNGKMIFSGNDLTVQDFGGRISGSDFSLGGTLRNLLPWLFSDDEDLVVEAVLRSKRLDLNKLLTEGGTTSTKADTTYKLEFPEHLRVALRTEVDKLSFRKFEATNVRGTLALRDKKLVADPVLFSTMDGAVSGSGMIDGARGDTLLITCDAKITRVNISKLFAQMENFGQDVIQEKHLRGIVTSEVKFASLWSAALEVNEDKIYSRADIQIDRGELIGFEPMKELSEYIKLTELEHIKFSTLKNQVEIRNRKIILPFMDIESTAMNIGMSGTHTFDDIVDYKFRIRMEEYLARKAKTAKKENDEFGEIEPDGGHRFSLYLTMKGPLSNPEISYDRKGAVQRVKEDMKQEKQNLKEILHQEFGWFKKDSTVNKADDPKKKKEEKDKKKKPESDKFIIEWDKEGKSKPEEEDDF
ncbi:MAG: hypothetical protein FD123_810 [Bacteroidetes bacterium]|nr:MAG: hypothetical protein FD123_810 [Bacteroidota bacterium]